MSSFKFGQIEVPSKDFYKQRQITDIFAIDVNKVMLSDKVPWNNGKDWRYIEMGERLNHCFSRCQKTYSAMACGNMARTLFAHLMFLRHRSGCFSMETSGMGLSRNYLKN